MINGYSYHLNTSTPNDQHTRKDVEKLINTALDSVDPFLAVKKFLRYDGQILKAGEQSYVRADYRSIFLVAIGKAAIPMVISASEVLKDDYSSGLAITKKLANTGAIDHKIRVLIGDHPIPGEKSLKAADEVITFLGNVTPDDLVIFLISGGGSALISKPITGISFGDIQAVTRGLVDASVSIQQINTIRKHLDIVKGGGLLKMVLPARVISLVLSDVIGNDLSVIASGPTVPDPSSFQDCLEIISSSDLMGKIPESVLSFLRDGAEGKQDETIKPAHVDVKLHDEILIGSIDLAIKALMQTGDELGYRTKRSAQFLVYDIEFEKNRITDECSDLFTSGGGGKSIMVWGGEVTVKRSEGGRGGRNQHLALLLAEEFKSMKGIVGVALATDGEDGSTDAAGVVIDSTTLSRAGVLGLDYQRAIREQESYGFFQKLNDLIYTGPTGTNVNDLFFIIKEEKHNE